MLQRAQFAAIFGFFAFVLYAYAQSTGAGTLVGTISDSSGAAVASARVNVVNTETAFLSDTVTSAEGAMYVPYLAPGTYRLTIEAAGFKRYVRDGILIRSGETPRLDIALEVGSQTESVTVSGGAPLLATDDAATAQTLSGDELVKLPVSQKTAQRMLWYYPGNSSVSGYHLLGQRQNAIGYQIDGVSGKEPGIQSFGGTDTQVSTTTDAFQEVKVYTTGTPAEYGHAAGGLMSVVFKSGTNQLHGSAEERYVGKEMVHRSILEQLQPTAPFQYHEATGLLSGPVVLPKLYHGKDKTFWLFGWESHVETGGTASAITTVPTPQEYTGDFSFGGQTSPKLQQIYNPFTTQLINGVYTRDPFPGNIIPASLIDPAVARFLGLTPFTTANQPGIPSSTGPTQNLVQNQTKEIRRTRWDTKIDHQFTPNHRIFGRYSVAHHRADKGDAQAQFAFRALDPNSEPQPVNQDNVVLSDVLILNPTLNNEFRLGYNRRALYQTALTDGTNYGQLLGIPNIGNSFPNFNIGYGISQLGDYQNVGEDITMQDNVIKIKGKHELKFGYELIRTRYNSSLLASPGGTYNFGGTELPFTPNTGNPFASFLLGTVTSATYTQSVASWLPRWWSHQGYVQDNWRPLANLSVNLGLRYSYETPYQTKYGQQSQFSPTTIDPLTGRLGAITHPSGPLAGSDTNNFAPRIGVSWNFRPSWVFRGSFGMIHQDIFAYTQNILFDEYLATATVQAAPGDPNYAFRLSNGPPAVKFPVASNGTVPFVGSNYSTRTASEWDPNMRMPYVLNWSGGFQWEFARNWLLELQYQGQSGVGLVNGWNINTIPLNVSTDPTVLNQIYQASQNYLPYPQFGNVTLYSNFSHNSYHGGTVRMERRYASGLAFNAFYTYSKTLTDVTGEGLATGETYYNRSLEKGRADFDIRHHFVSVMTYELPFGQGRRWMNHGGFLNAALGGWELAWTQTLQSGQPFTVTYSNSPNKYLPGSVARPNILTTNEQALTPDWGLGPNRFPTSAQNPYLNLSSFAYPAAYTVGNLGRNTFEGPGMNYTQLSMSKWWQVKEKYRFQLRWDGYNFPFKQPNFANPNTVYNASSPGTFARFTAVQGSYSNLGGGRPSFYLSGRFQF